MAPGMSTMMSVSTISIVVMESVSEAKASGATRRSAEPGAQQRAGS